MAHDLRTNERIRISPIRLIDQDNEQIGIISTDEALRRAREAGLDLVEVAPGDRPPVCRIMDHGKWKYQQKKKHKGRRGHDVQIKEVRIRPKTDRNDRLIKMNRAVKFLNEGDKVQFTMIFRGRERFHVDRGLAILKGIADELEELAKTERLPRMDGGRRMTMLLAPLKTAVPASKPKSKAPKAAPKPAPPAPKSADEAPAPAAPPAPPEPPPPTSATQESAVRAEG